MITNRLKNKTVLITGVSSGIGEACAHRFATDEANLILVARKETTVTKLKSELLKQQPHLKIHTALADVRDKSQVDALFSNLPPAFSNIDILINNAGLSLGLEHVAVGDNTDWETMIDTNIKGLMYVTHATLQGMYQRKSGHIINLGSIAGIFAYANGAAYCATKAAVHAYTRALREECIEKNIKVSEILPGAVNTEFSTTRFHGDKERADNVYKGFTPLVAADIADIISYTANLPTHVNMAEIVVMPSAQANAHKTNKTI